MALSETANTNMLSFGSREGTTTMLGYDGINYTHPWNKPAFVSLLY